MEEAGAGLSSRRSAEEAMVQSWAALVEAEADMGAAAGALAKIGAAAAAIGSLEFEEEEEEEEDRGGGKIIVDTARSRDRRFFRN